MSKVKATGIVETIKMLEKIEGNTDYILEDALTKGGGVVADVMRSEISSLKTSDEYEGGNGKRYAKSEDVKGLLAALGYTPVQLNGSVFDINTGFDGYNSNVTKKYPQGHANQMIANAINKGTSFMIAQPFINKTAKRARAEALKTIEAEITKGINKLQ